MIERDIFGYMERFSECTVLRAGSWVFSLDITCRKIFRN